MRLLYFALIVAFTGIVALFKFQNLETVTVSLFAASFTLPVSVLVVFVYVLGMLPEAHCSRSCARGSSVPAPATGDISTQGEVQ